MANAERIDETVERYLAAPADRSEQIADRGRAIALFVLKLDPVVALFEGKDIGGLAHPSLLAEQFDLLFAQPIDVEGAARGEQHQMLDLLERTGELAGAARARTFLAGRGFLTHNVGMQVARAFGRKTVGLRRFGTLVEHDIDNLRND